MARKRPAVRCRATSKRTGQQCGNFCSPGHHVCRHHGAGAPQTKQRAEERVTEAQALKNIANAEPINNPWDAMSEIAGEAAELEKALRAKIKIDDYSSPALITAWTRSLERVARVLADLGRMDPEATKTKITARQVEQVSTAWKEADAAWLKSLRQALPPEVHPALEEWTRTERPRIARAALLAQRDNDASRNTERHSTT